MRWRYTSLCVLIAVVTLAAVLLSNVLLSPPISATEALLQPAPSQPVGYYDYFGKLLSPQQAEQLVRQKGLDPNSPGAYDRIGAIQITQQLIDSGENIFFNRKIGDTLGLQRVFGFGVGFTKILPEVTEAILKLHGKPTTNLRITLKKDLTLGSRTYRRGSVIDTGLNVEKRSLFPQGLQLDGNLTCALCHVDLSGSGKRLKGVPNGDLNIPLLIALAPNTAAGFARLNLNPLDPKYQGDGRTIIDSRNNLVKLPDPNKFEAAFDDAVLDVPFGQFESSPDRINNTTQIPNVFTFNTNPYLADGQFAVGPFGGLSAVNNAVHSSEINLLAAAQLSAQTIGIDPEVYLGVVLQNAVDPLLRLPKWGPPIKPSQWLRLIAPDASKAELEAQIPAPGTGNYPELKPNLFTYNGLVFSPNTNSQDVARGPFLFASNAMSAWQNSLIPPANRSQENQQALQRGSVERGAKVFEQANCATCHIPPFFTDNVIHPLREINTNSARAKSRLDLDNLLVPPKLYAFNNPVPIPANAEVLDVPTAGVSDTPTSLPKGLLPDGGYKTTSLRGLYLSAPYLHDGGVAVRSEAIQVRADGSFSVVDPTGLGLSGTLSVGKLADAASSLRALIDRNLRAQVVAANRANSALVRSNLDGIGHDFYVDQATGFTPAQQADLINFLLALDDNPGRF